MTRRSLAVWQLGVLTGVHFTVDMFSGMLPGFLPRLLELHSLSIGMGAVLLTLCGFSANGVQIWAGTLRRRANRPFLVQLGLILACVVCLIGVIPVGSGAMFWLILLVLTLGIGVALVHPEGLRGICMIDAAAVSPAVATSVFMLSGFLGSASGPLVSGLLVENLGFAGLWLLVIPVAVLLRLLHNMRIRLAMESGSGTSRRSAAATPSGAGRLSFWEIFWVATFINTASGIMQGLLPTFLSDSFHFSLTFCGLSAMLFGAGAGVGALLTSIVSKKYDVIDCIQLEIICGIPLLILYLLLAGTALVAPLGFLAGMLVGAGFPQLVVLARSAAGGPGLGARMGLIVGGTWGIAGLLLLLAGFVADRWGIRAAMFLSPLFFLLGVVCCHILARKRRGKKLA